MATLTQDHIMSIRSLNKPDLYQTMIDLQNVIGEICQQETPDMLAIEHYIDERNKVADEFYTTCMLKEIHNVMNDYMEIVKELDALIKEGHQNLSYICYKSFFERDIPILARLLKPKAKNLNKPDEPI